MAGLLSGYSSTTRRGIQKRYTEKLELVDVIDPYEVAKGIWQDDVDPSSESLLRKDCLNLKSLDCYQNFVRGWVRQVLMKPVCDKQIVIRKVSLS